MPAPAILAQGLTKRFGDRLAVDGLDFEVEHGEVFGFLGPNGAGKTTTVRMLTGLLKPTSGRAVVAGVSLEPAQGRALRSRIAVMPETPGLYLKLSVGENLEYFAGLYQVTDPAERIASALKAVGLTDRQHDLAGKLSKGLRQRAALARTLISSPEILFLDEPTTGLDPEASVDVRELISDLRRQGMTVFLTTHRLDEAERLCDRVAILSTRLLSVGDPDQLRRQRFGATLEVWTATPLPNPAAVFESVKGVKGWEGDLGRYRVMVDDATGAAPLVATEIVRAGADLLRLAEVSQSLEDAYLELIAEERS